MFANAPQKRSFSSRLALTTLVLLAGVSHAHALEGKALFEKLLAEAGPKAISIQYGAITETDSASFAAQNLELTVEGRSASMKIGNLIVQNLQEQSDGRITYGNITLANWSMDNKRGAMTLDTLTTTKGGLPKAMLKGRGFKPSAGDKIEFDTYALSGLKFSNERRESNMALGSVTISDASIPLNYNFEGKGELANDMPFLKLDSFTMNDMMASGNGSTAKLDFVGLDELNIPTDSRAGTLAFMMGIRGITMKGFSVATRGNEMATIEEIQAGIQKKEDTQFASQFAMNGMKVNLNALPDPQTQAVMGQLGYETLEVSFTGASDYDTQSGVLALKDMALDLKDMLKLNINYKISGYTLELADQLQKTQLNAQKNGASGQAVMMQLLPLLTQLKLDNLSLSLTDQSLTGKLLDFQAKQMGTTGDQLAAGAPMMMGIGLAGLGMPALTDMLTQAVGTFLKDKGTLTASVNPDNSVSVGEIMQVSQTDPRKLPELLNLKVSAQ